MNDILSRDEFKRELSVMEGHAAEWGRIIDHDYAQRAEIAALKERAERAEKRVANLEWALRQYGWKNEALDCLRPPTDDTKTQEPG